MSLPNYIINLEEMVQAIVSGYKSMKLFNNGHQKSKGVNIKSHSTGVQSVVWKPEEVIGITGVRISQDDVRNLGYDDFFHLYVEGEQVMNQVYFKEMVEYKTFRSVYLVSPNVEIKFEYHNKTGIPKEIWFDIDYIQSTIPQKEVVVICRRRDNNQELTRYSSYYNPPTQVIINPPTVDGYTIASNSTTINFTPNTPSPQIVVFYYDEVVIPPFPDPNINHPYDWKFVLRWQGEVSTDLDFHARFDNVAHIYYAKREFIVDDKNRVWYDVDHTSHMGYNDRQEKPEIITVLGKPSETVRLSVVNFKGGNQLTEDVTVEIYKVRPNNTEELIDIFTKPASEFHSNKAEVHFCTVNLITETVVAR